MRKKRALAALIAVACLAAAWTIASGFFVNTDVYVTEDFTVSEDGRALTFTVEVGSSMGHVRGYRDEGGGELPHALKFYSAWGGLNSSLGARSEFTLQIGPEDTEICIYRGDGGYVPALQKDAVSGEWHRV